MEAIYYKVPRLSGQTIRAEYWDLPCFFQPFHYHKDCQLTLILSSRGFLYMSDGCISFMEGDLFLLGRNVPHVFRTADPESVSSQKPARAITVFFDYEQFSKLFAVLPEAVKTSSLCRIAQYGIKVSLEAKSEMIRIMHHVLGLKGVEQVTEVIKLLSKLAHMEGHQYVSYHSVALSDPLDSRKIEQVLGFIRDNHKRAVSLENVAEQINMTPSAFCRFFKKKTNKTFTNYLIEIRIAAACRLLTEQDFTVSESCYESGYNSTSNFHRHFRRVTGFSPNEYKHRFLSGTLE